VAGSTVNRRARVGGEGEGFGEMTPSVSVLGFFRRASDSECRLFKRASGYNCSHKWVRGLVNPSDRLIA